MPLVVAEGTPSLPEGRTIQLEYAPSMRAGDSQIVALNLSAGNGPAGADVYETYHVIAEARLDLPFADVRPADVVSAALSEGSAATFYWDVSAQEEGTLRGTAWLYLRFVPKAGGPAGETRQPVSAQLVEINPKSMLGRTGSQARVIGLFGSLIGSWLGFPFLRTLAGARRASRGAK